ncbi:putative malate:quinone oxidoreductase [Thiohalobacter sp. COW1]|uniref:FAD-dependent oxidoreductase n=1 Tax=Thiohalobacter sp. COW1 TaxID=2795687 RepID=UPI001915FEB1|nr:FAD-dependent oxidoreductase [Thiohalobacter sp. COW1]BCO30784.1 putative malate:quinone oxidoreductase [Thiohalobacter sp. COW1]
MPTTQYDLLIIGAGISGTALLYLAARYSDIERIGILEKYAAPAQVNTLSSNNSQTLHCGDIETNYSLDKALKVQQAARKLANYCLRQPDREHLIFKYPKMVLGVGETECAALRKRFDSLSPHYPALRLLEKQDIARIEPAVATGADGHLRPEPLLALGSTDEYTAVDFGAVSRSFLRQAQAVPGKQVDVHYNEPVTQIVIEDNGLRVDSGQACYRTRALVVCAGGHSLKLAQDLGYGLEYSCLPVAGSYYFTPQILNGKVYTVQNDKLPFAAIHGDPDVMVPGKTRFGPTALILPILERYNYRTLPDFLRVLRFDRRVAQVLWDLLKVRDIRHYMAKNLLFEVPVLRKGLFLRDVRKIVPALRYGDLSFARRFGGIRPQLIDKPNAKLLMGEAKIDTGRGAIFNMTPSPGGTSCLDNAEKDLRSLADFLGAAIDDAALAAELDAPGEPA